MSNLEEAKRHLDIVIKKGRVHLYKPIQLAEILYAHRKNRDFDLLDLESYRNISKRWRDAVSQILVGGVSTSSARFQDNLFEPNAIPPQLIYALGEENEKPDRIGIVEAYIYQSLEVKMESLKRLAEYLKNATPNTFQLGEFIEGFVKDPGLKRSIDKAYEITVYAIFTTLVRHLKATVTIGVPNSKIELLREFEDFTKVVLGLTAEMNEITIPAMLYRVGVANAADRGLDMWANFGPAVQIKHLSLTEEFAEEIVSQVSADRIVIVCKTAEKNIIERILKQLGFSDKVQGIITQNDLEKWYAKCFSERYKSVLGATLLKDLNKEFLAEFPSLGDALTGFMESRGYNLIKKKGIFAN